MQPVFSSLLGALRLSRRKNPLLLPVFRDELPQVHREAVSVPRDSPIEWAQHWQPGHTTAVLRRSAALPRSVVREAR